MTNREMSGWREQAILMGMRDQVLDDRFVPLKLGQRDLASWHHEEWRNPLLP